jgi:hypothetical protein
MKEDFLHYLWQHKKFRFTHLQTTKGEPITILHSGQYLQLAGPDFFNAQLIIANQKWAGNIEIHLKSSDWYVHHHQNDDHYNNVILHVVWEHDTAVFRKDNSEIPVLELKSYVTSEEISNYNALLTPKSWIFCEKQLVSFDKFVLSNWLERLFFERLERKSIHIEQLLQDTENDWEAVLFCLLAKNFGLNTNGDSFYKMAKSIPFHIVRKEALEVNYLESLFFGQAGMIPNTVEDTYLKELQAQYDYLAIKYKLERPIIEPIEFFKHRPDNFPTIRIAQLSMLYHLQRNLFSSIFAVTTSKEIYQIFDVAVSRYWKTHYNFDKSSPKKEKSLSKAFIDLVIINTIVPLQFAYSKSQGKDISEQLLTIINTIAPEKNAIIDKFQSFGIISKSAFETQSLLQLKNDYCNAKKCLQCAVGIALIKN